MMGRTFTLRHFGWALRARGPDLSTWPAPERAAAMQLLRGNAEARTLLADALAADDGAEADAPGLCRMQAAVRRALAPPPPLLRGMRWGALAGCIAAGLYLGLLPATEADPGGVAPTFAATSSATVLAALDP